MFGKTYKTVLTLDADDKPTAIASTTEENAFTGMISGLTSKFTKDTVVTGLGRTLSELGQVWGVAAFTRSRLGFDFSINPLAR